MGSTTRARTSRRNGISTRARTQARGVPRTKTTPAATRLTVSETRSDSSTGRRPSRSPSEVHGARWTRPTKGRASTVMPTTATTRTGLGARTGGWLTTAVP